MKKSTRYALFAIFLLALFLRLFPLMNTLYWGADYGEYYYLSRELLTNNHISTQYFGWGAVYPDFPGMEILSSSVSLLSEVSLALSLSLVAPILASLTVIFIFLIAVEIFKDERIGLVAAGFVAVVLPHVYPTSHPMPGSIGDLLLVVCLLLFIKMQSNPRFMAALLPLTLALIMTHHLSTYFLLICIIVAVFLKAVYTKNLEVRGFKATIGFTAIFVVMTLLYWGISENFMEKILGLIFPWYFLLLILPLALVFIAAFAIFRNKINYRPSIRYPSFKSSAAGFLLILFAVLIILSVLVFIGIPGTTMKLHYSSFLVFLPFVVYLSFSGFGRGYHEFYREGVNIMGWLFAVVASLFVGTFFASKFLIPYRHMEYLMIPLSFFVGLGLVFFYDFWVARGAKKEGNTNPEESMEKANGKAGKKRIAVFLLVLFLISANAFSAYPSREAMLGYNEGTNAKSLEAVIWIRFEADEYSTVASDHKLSSIIFGFGSKNSTWDKAPLTLMASSFEDAKDEMIQVELPSGTKRIDYVLIDEEVKEGAIIYIWDDAEPLSQEAIEKFNSSNYTKLYDSGYAQIYMVNW